MSSDDETSVVESIDQLMAIADALFPNCVPFHIKWRAVTFIKHFVE